MSFNEVTGRETKVIITFTHDDKVKVKSVKQDELWLVKGCHDDLMFRQQL